MWSTDEGPGADAGLDEKYVVFKADEYERSKFPTKLDPASYFVIRSQDVFGAPGLYAYAHTIQTGLELHKLTGCDLFSVEEAERLEELMDLLTQLASSWAAGKKKIPD